MQLSFGFLADEAGIEPTTPGLEGRCSIRLSYSPAETIVASIRPAAESGAAPLRPAVLTRD